MRPRSVKGVFFHHGTVSVILESRGRPLKSHDQVDRTVDVALRTVTRRGPPDKRSSSYSSGVSAHASQRDMDGRNDFSSDGGAVKKTGVRFGRRGLLEPDAVWSPASPVAKVFSSGINGRLKCWDSSRVGLGLIDALSVESSPCGKVLGFPRNDNIVFASQMRSNTSIPKSSHQVGLGDDSVGAAPKSLQPRIGSSKPGSVCSGMIIELRGCRSEHEEFGLLHSCPVDTGRSLLLAKSILRSNSEALVSDSENSMDSWSLAKEDTSFSSSYEFIGSLSASEIEQSEDYTCITSHGPNPKKTHIFGDCILDSHCIESPTIRNKHRKDDEGSCKKNSEGGKHICTHRITSSVSPASAFHEETFLDDMKPAS
ncbi:hypothetical protein B296_00021410 [Ensete ventricosum]|uniref:Uncharacterized protein n=1 Tax=Ensete ventricosum TaxID=4639 RepID=A0A427A8X2_ENSVE|nr:hypothetical protein B296_00021410 [Ensete ventricosum]